MSAQRMPVSVTASLALHGGLLGAYVLAAQLQPRHTTHFVPGVDIIRVSKPLPQPAQAAPKPPPAPASAFNFLKLALPAIPKSAAPLELKMKLPERQMTIKTPEQLKEATRKAAPEIKPLDLNERSAPKALSAMSVPEVASHHSLKSLAQMPALEDVGRHQVANLPKALKLEDERRQAVQQMAFEKMNAPTHAHIAPTQAMLPTEAAPAESTSRARKVFESVLPAEQALREQPQVMRASQKDVFKETAIAPAKHAGPAAQMEEGKKGGGVQIEGALQNRGVVSSDIPRYPDWLKKLGTPDASVRLNFCVDPGGGVIGPSISPDLSSGYGQLDRLCEGSLRNWKFSALGSQENQCGKITFNFELE